MPIQTVLLQARSLSQANSNMEQYQSNPQTSYALLHKYKSLHLFK